MNQQYRPKEVAKLLGIDNLSIPNMEVTNENANR